MVRNIRCKSYGDCLVKTAKENNREFSCGGCLHETDESGMDDVVLQDIIACELLIHQIFAESHPED